MVRLFVVLFALCFIKDAFPAPVKKGRCSGAMDIAFILDASGSVGSTMWKNTLRISKKFVNEFGASEDGNHYAVITFSTEPQIDMKFNEYNGTDLSSEKISGDIDGLKRIRGYTFIDRALRKAARELFTVEAGMRQNARKVAVVVTDGLQTKNNRDPYENLRNASSGLKAKGVEIYAVGVGRDVNVLELLVMTGSDYHVYNGRKILRQSKKLKNTTFCEIRLLTKN